MCENICINIDATGRRKELEQLAENFTLKVEDSRIKYLTAIDYISLVGSIITIIEFLLQIKNRYGKRLLIDNVPVDNAIRKLLKQSNVYNVQMENHEKW